MNQDFKWEWELSANNKKIQLGLRELWQYRGLIQSFARRELIANYQQTIMGMSWLVIQPVLTTLFYLLVFGRILKISTDGVPPLLFYMSGSLLWGFFTDCLMSTMYTFKHNAHIFSKVYFPRLVIPISLIGAHIFRFFIQFTLFILIYLFYWISGVVHPSIFMLWLPIVFLATVALGMGIGMIVSIYLARYNDLDPFMNFFLRLLMFITPVVYPASIIPNGYKFLLWANPLTPIIEYFKAGFFFTKPVNPTYLFISFFITLIIFLCGLILFKKKELSVMDTI
jgi:lipopolysaccharide transport system permease protein